MTLLRYIGVYIAMSCVWTGMRGWRSGVAENVERLAEDMQSNCRTHRDRATVCSCKYISAVFIRTAIVENFCLKYRIFEIKCH